jgi:hypothetical protein
MEVTTNQEISYSMRISPTEAKTLNNLCKKVATGQLEVAHDEEVLMTIMGKILRKQMRESEGLRV